MTEEDLATINAAIDLMRSVEATLRDICANDPQDPAYEQAEKLWQASSLLRQMAMPF